MSARMNKQHRWGMTMFNQTETSGVPACCETSGIPACWAQCWSNPDVILWWRITGWPRRVVLLYSLTLYPSELLRASSLRLKVVFSVAHGDTHESDFLVTFELLWRVGYVTDTDRQRPLSVRHRPLSIRPLTTGAEILKIPYQPFLWLYVGNSPYYSHTVLYNFASIYHLYDKYNIYIEILMTYISTHCQALPAGYHAKV